MHEHIYIEGVSPTVDLGRYPAKCIAGEPLKIGADIFRDSHDKISAKVRYRRVDAAPDAWTTVPLTLIDKNDRWACQFTPEAPGDHVFVVDAWTDVFGTWLDELEKKIAAGVDVSVVLQEGLQHADNAQRRARGHDRAKLGAAWAALKAASEAPKDTVAAVQSPVVRALMDRCMPRLDAVTSGPYRLIVDRERARFSAWYEFFPRSEGTLRDAAKRLRGIKDMGFDVVYVPPVHPIGTSFRKGKNNALTCEATDVGSPWAIGNEAGGHTAIEPALGTLEDFDHFVATAHNLGLEIAMDFAIQCSPDHPWVKEHPEWFHHRPDGTIKYAENPPKKYQDVYFINFDTPKKMDLWQAWRDVMQFWVNRSVKIFRVDNPHTKSFAFWEWALTEIRQKDPDVFFLSEAFTKPKPMKLLAKLGFNQSYTYFTWRNTSYELKEYLTELSTSGMQQYFRPNFFANTPDILPEFLQTGGRPAFKIRAVLAALLSPTYGIYSGFELCENAPLKGCEEYLDSEKYELKARNWQAEGNITGLLKTLNTLRQTHPALQVIDNITFFDSDNDQLLAFGKKSAQDRLIVVLNLDSHHPHHGTITVPRKWLGDATPDHYEVHDALTGAAYTWSEKNYVRLAPDLQPAHVFTVH